MFGNVIYLDLKQEELDEAIANYKRLKNPKTNMDKVRAMDIDHLIEWFCRGRWCGDCPFNCLACRLREWLQMEVDNG